MLILKSLKDSIGNGKDLNSSNSMEYLLSIKPIPQKENNSNNQFNNSNSNNNDDNRRLEIISEETEIGESNDIILQRFLSNCSNHSIILNDIPNTLDGILMLGNNNAWSEVFKRFTEQLQNSDQSSINALNALKLKSTFLLKKFDIYEQLITSSLKNLDNNSNNDIKHVFYWQILRIDVYLASNRTTEAMHIMHSLPVIPDDKHKDLQEIKLITNFNILIASKRYKVAIKGLVNEIKSLDDSNFKLILYGHLIHLLVYTGLLQSAIYYSNQLQECVCRLNLPESHVISHNSLICQALVLYAQEEYECAAVLYHLVISGISNSSSSSGSSSNSNNTNTNNSMSIEDVHLSMDSLLSTAINNFCICCVHLKLINRCVQMLEQFIQRNPQNALSDTVVFNLCTIYDLKSSQLLSSKLKKVLYNVAQIYHRSELDFKSFRI